MDLKKFTKFTNNDTKIRKIVPYSFYSAFEYLLVTRVINYYTVEVIIYNNNMLNKWKFILNEVDTLDNKLSQTNRDYLKQKLEAICLNNYFRFKVTRQMFQELIGSILLDDTHMQINSAVNTMMVNMTINLIILKDKINDPRHKEKNSFYRTPSPLKHSFTPSKLIPILEDDDDDLLEDISI